MKSLTFISGCPRSGASIVAGIIDICGGSFGGVDKMYENTEIKFIVKSFMDFMGVDSAGQYPLPKNVDEFITPQLLVSLYDDIMNCVNGNGNQFVYKDSRLILLWKIFMKSFPLSKWVIVRRDENSIIDSCLKTSYMNAFNDSGVRSLIKVDTIEAGWRWWLRAYENRFKLIKESGIQVKEIYPEKMVVGDYSEIKGIVEWLELEWKEKEVQEYVRLKLSKSIKKEEVK